MPKRPDTLETALIAIELLRHIPRRGKVSAAELHDKLAAAGYERDLRSVQRLMKQLSDKFDIECDDRNKPYGYKWKENAQGLALPILSEQESLLLALAEQQLQNLLPASLAKSMRGFFNQARANLGSRANAKRALEWLAKVRVVATTQPLLPPKIADGVFEQVSNALYNNYWLEVDYKNADGKRTKADVMPLGLAQQGARLYLVCRYKGYEQERSLALNRIISAEASTLPFDRPKEFDLQQYENDGRFGYGSGKRITLTILIEKSAGLHLLESPLSADQQVKEIGDQYQIRATVVDSALLDRWLRGFGEQVSGVRKTRKISKPLD